MKMRLLIILALNLIIGFNIFAQEFPQTAFFRNENYVKENDVNLDHISKYDIVIIKLYNEEIYKPKTDAVVNNMVEFKKRYPNKKILCHFNVKEVRRPGEIERHEGAEDHVDPDNIFPGHYAYYTGTKLSSPIDSSTTKIKVKDITKLFIDDDLRLVNGSDLKSIEAWEHSEVVFVKSISYKDNTVTVERGKYYTKAKDFDANAYVLPHAKRTFNWGGNGWYFWFYNLTRLSPKDAQGKDCPTWLAHWMADKAKQVNEEQNINLIDGYEFDVNSHIFYVPSYTGSDGKKVADRGLDVNLDQKDDQGYVDNVPAYGLGGLDLARELREKMGDKAIIIGDLIWNTWKAIPYANGYDQESFPMDGHKAWSGAFENSQIFNNGLQYPKVSLFMTRAKTDNIEPWQKDAYQVFRLASSAAIMLGNIHTASFGNQGSFMWDEYKGGILNKQHWLGKPLEDYRRYASQNQNMFPFGKFNESKDLENIEFQIKGGTVAKVAVTLDNANKVEGSSSLKLNVNEIPENIPTWAWNNVSLIIKGVNVEKDKGYTLRFNGRGSSICENVENPHKGIPYTMRMGISNPKNDKDGYAQSIILPNDWHEYNLSFVPEWTERMDIVLELGIEAGECNIDNVRLVEGGSDVFSREFENGLVLTNATNEATTFDLKKLYPKGKFKRLMATIDGNDWQSDQGVNNGETITDEVVVPAYDGLFLLKKDVVVGTEDKETVQSFGMKVNMNPFSEQLVLKFSKPVDVPFSIYDMLGRKVFSSTTGMTININTSDWNKGLYILAIEGETPVKLLKN